MKQIDIILNSPCGHLNKHLEDKPLPKKKKAKYGNNKKEVDGILFDSTKEATRYGQLKILRKIGEIGLLELQVPFLLIEANGKEKKCQYFADFVYLNTKTGERIVEDVKSEATRKLPTYIMKRKLMKSVHGIEIKET